MLLIIGGNSAYWKTKAPRNREFLFDFRNSFDFFAKMETGDNWKILSKNRNFHYFRKKIHRASFPCQIFRAYAKLTNFPDKE